MQKLFRLALAVFPLAFLAAAKSFAADAPPAAPGITDAEIRDIVTRVAKHQLHPLADGDYALVHSVDAAKAAKAPVGIEWDYPWGVTLYGLSRSTDATGDADAGRFVTQHNQICGRYYDWMTALNISVTNKDEVPAFTRGTKLQRLFALGSLDNCGAMGTEMLDRLGRNPAQVTVQEQAVVARVANWVAFQQDRMTNGTLWRPKAMGGTLWPDDLYMGGVFLAHWGQFIHDQKFIDDAASQIINQAAVEQDADGLWFHGYFVNEQKHAPFKWGRGNGWVTVALVETLSVMPDNDPLRPRLIEILNKQVDGLKKVQAPDGMWRQVLDKPELWEETSCTAMFAYGIARAAGRGWIDAANLAVARQAFAGLAKNVTAEGVVKGTCEGTGIGTNLDFYITRRQPDDDLHGRGPVLLAGTELLLAGKK